MYVLPFQLAPAPDDEGWFTLPVVPGTGPALSHLDVAHIKLDFRPTFSGADLLAAYDLLRKPPEPPA